ncbi:MAG: NUDIX hydrolase [Pseudomonadota bacterium]
MNFCSNCGHKVERAVPEGDTHERWVCPNCGMIHYQNPKIVVGCVPERDGKILLCKRAIEPRHGYWTVPAGFMELQESMAEGAARETQEEAMAEVEIHRLFAAVDVPHAGQVHVFFTASLISDFAPGPESLDCKMVTPDEIPWDEIAFPSGTFALRKWVEDGGQDRGVHLHTAERRIYQTA